MNMVAKRIIAGLLSRITSYSIGFWSRPQEPKNRPYRIEAIGFSAGEGNVWLEGELTMPHGDGPFPAVVLVSGSGPQDRNEKIAGHKPFLVLSDYLFQPSESGSLEDYARIDTTIDESVLGKIGDWLDETVIVSSSASYAGQEGGNKQ